MKILKGWVPIFVIGAIAYSQFDLSSNSSSDSSESKRSNPVEQATYGNTGTASGWPSIEEGFAEVTQTINTINYYLVLDGSGSMADSGCSDGREKLSVAKTALKSFVSKVSSDANVGFYAFDKRGIGERLPIANHGSSRVSQAIDEIQAGGGTPLSIAVSEANKALTEQAKKQLGYGEYHLVIVTDGEANRGYAPDAAVRELLAGSPIVLHTVGFCIDDSHSLNQPGYTLYKSANDPASLVAGLEEVLAEAPDFSVSDFSSN